MKQQNYSKTFIPLESDPQVFTDLAHQLGLADSVVFKELFSLQEHIDGQILAYILIFPTTPSYDAERAAENNGTSAVKPDVVFLKQTIHNACGLYAMLHAACNGRAQSFIKRDSFLHALIKTSAEGRTQFLDESQELERSYAVAANAGYTQPPNDPEADVDYHYTCFVPSIVYHRLYELDGDRQGPLKHVVLAEDVTDFSSQAIDIIQDYFGREKGDKAVHFNVMALVKQP